MASKRKSIKVVHTKSILKFVDESVAEQYDKNLGCFRYVSDLIKKLRELPPHAVIMSSDSYENHYDYVQDYELVSYRLETDEEYKVRLQKSRKSAALAKQRKAAILKQQEDEERAVYERLKAKFETS